MSGSRFKVPLDAQRRFKRLHPRIRMTKRTWVVGFLILLFLWISGIGGFVLGTAKFYLQVARLYTQSPDARLAMPLENIRKRQITDTWHAPRGTDRRHEGQDIFAPRGTPILSATPGLVYNIGQSNLGGQTVSVVGRGGRIYYYAHLDAYAPSLEEGDWVTTRTVLGYVGTSGNAQGTPPHLHFGVYSTGGAINPLPLLTDRVPQEAVRQTRESKTKQKLVNRKI